VKIGILPRRYANALLALATQANNVDKILSDLRDFEKSWSESKELRSVFENPSVGMASRRQILRDIAAESGMDPLLVNTLLLLSDRGRLSQLPGILAAYEELTEARSGRVRADVVTASELPEAYYEGLREVLERVTGKQVSVTRRVDPSLLGGVVTRIGDQVFDGSLSTRLNELKNELSR
jgi:F-type H+-transporting ATPase subunit delta